MGNKSPKAFLTSSKSDREGLAEGDLLTYLLYAKQPNGIGQSAPSSSAQDALGRVTMLHNMHIRNARNLNMSFESHGFELVDHMTTLSHANFLESDETKIKQVYYNELAEFVKVRLGASHVVPFHHKIRSADASHGEQPAGVAHADYTVKQAISLYDSIGVKPEYRKGRFIVLNIWRNISDDHLITDHHLAMCDATSVVAPDDFILLDNPEHYGLSPIYHKRHQWYYYPFMSKNEILMFMQYDSDPSARARYTFHSSIRDQSLSSAAGTTPRESIEVRIIAFFPDYHINTMPEHIYGEDDLIESAVSKILLSIAHMEKWDGPGKTWFIATMTRPFGTHIAIQGLVRSGSQRGLFGLDGATAAQQQQIIAKLKQSNFESIARDSIRKLQQR
jgi:hypothetical protein